MFGVFCLFLKFLCIYLNMLAFGLKQAVVRNCNLSPDSDGLSQELRAPAATRRGDAFQGGE